MEKWIYDINKLQWQAASAHEYCVINILSKTVYDYMEYADVRIWASALQNLQ